MDTKISNAYAYINHINNVVVDANSATATNITDLYSKYNNSVAQIYELNQTFANTNTAVATEINRMTSKIDNNTATIYQLSQTVVDHQSATALQINQLSSQLLDNLSQSDIYQLNQTIADNQSATATQINSLNSKFDGANASIFELNQTIANTNAAVATQIVTLNSHIDGANARIDSLAQTIVSPNSAIATQIDTLTSQVANSNARITSLSQTVADANSAMAQSLDTLSSRINTNNTAVYSSITELERTFANANVATSIRIDNLSSGLAGANASITELSQTVVTANTATARDFESLRSNVDNVSARVDILASTSTANGISTSTYGVRLDANGVITGLQTFAGSNGASTFDIYASTFRLTDPNNPALKYAPIYFRDGELHLGNTVVDGYLIINGTVVTDSLANKSVSEMVVSTGSDPIAMPGNTDPISNTVVYNPIVDSGSVVNTNIDWSNFNIDLGDLNIGGGGLFAPMPTSLQAAGASALLMAHNIVLKRPARVVMQGYVYANDGGGHSANSHRTSVEIKITPQGGTETTVAANIVSGVPWAVSQSLFVTGAIALPEGTHYVSLVGTTANNDYFTQKFLMSQWLYK